MRDSINLVAQARCLIDLSKKTGISLDKLRSELFNAGKPEVKILKKILETLASDFAEPICKKDCISA